MEKSAQVAVIFSLTILTVIVLYAFRTFDDNRLVNWEWVFGVVNLRNIMLLFIPGCVAAFILSRSSAPEHHPAPFLFVMSFAAAALFWKEPEMIVDASRYFTQAKHLELYGSGYFLKEWGKTIEAWTDLPLMSFISGLAFRYLGEARIYVQIINTLLFSFTVVLTYLTGKRLWDKETGFYGGMFMLGYPYVFTQVPLMLVDISSMFFLMLAVYVFISALEKGGHWIPAAAASLFLAVFSKFSVWLMLSIVLIAAAVYLFEVYRSPGKNRLRTSLARIGIIVGAAGLAAGSVMLVKYDLISSQINLLLAFQKPGLGRWGESFISTFLFQTHPLITASAFCSVWAAWRKKDPKYLIIVWLIALIAGLQVRRIRYTMVVFPFFSLMAAYGLKPFFDSSLKKRIVFSVAACSLTVALFAYLPFLQQTSARNLQLAGAFLDTLPGENIEVIAIPRRGDPVNMAVSVPLLDLFTDKRIHYSYVRKLAPPPEKIAVSPLRFTWFYKNPAYYSFAPASETAVAVITGEKAADFPEEIARKVKRFSNSKSFSISDDIFDHQTLVTVYY